MHGRITPKEIIAKGIVSSLSPFFASALADYFSRAIELSGFNPLVKEEEAFGPEYCSEIRDLAEVLSSLENHYRDASKNLFSEKAFEISDLLYKSGWTAYENSEDPRSLFLQALDNSWNMIVGHFTKHHVLVNPYEKDPGKIGEFLAYLGERYNKADKLKGDIEKIVESYGIDHKDMLGSIMQQRFSLLTGKIREYLTGLAELMETKSRTDFFPYAPNYNIKIGESELSISYVLGIASAYYPEIYVRLAKGYVRIYPSEKQRFESFIS